MPDPTPREKLAAWLAAFPPWYDDCLVMANGCRILGADLTISDLRAIAEELAMRRVHDGLD